MLVEVVLLKEMARLGTDLAETALPEPEALVLFNVVGPFRQKRKESIEINKKLEKKKVICSELEDSFAYRKSLSSAYLCSSQVLNFSSHPS